MLAHAPAVIGHFTTADGSHFLPASDDDLLKAKLMARKMFETLPLRPGSVALFISLHDEVVHIWPLEYAANDLGMTVMNCDANIYEGGRMESVIRRFDVSLIIGVNGAILDSLVAAGFDPAALFAGKTVWARGDAYDRLSPASDYRLLRFEKLGPAVGMECSEGAGLHVDSAEWTLSQNADGTIAVTCRMTRADIFRGVPTAIVGHIENQPCACGSETPRIVI